MQLIFCSSIGIAIHYPMFINSYHISKIICSLNQCTEPQRLLRLKILGKRLEVSPDIVQEVSDFQIVEWHKLLEDPNVDIQMNALVIIKRSVNSFLKMKIFPDIIKSLSRNIQHSNDLFRNGIYDTALLIYQECNGVGEYSQTAKNILIIGLNDPSEDNKIKVINIWQENMNLPDNIIARFVHILTELYVPKIEDRFLGFANYLLLHLIYNCDKFEDLIFEHPLEDCEFEDYNLQINWRLQHSSVVPLFAETLQSMDPEGTQNYMFQLRQTQRSMDFVPTQLLDHPLKTYTSINSSFITDQEHFKNPNNINLSTTYRQKRRFLNDKKKISASFAQHEIKKKALATPNRVQRAKERENKVTVYRNYRKGDFPDIQIPLSALIKPLQMLAMVRLIFHFSFICDKIKLLFVVINVL